MSGVNPSLPHSSKPQRVLACVLCQQRKVKCDRKFPCANCIKSRVQCVPASQVTRRRRRRFPERELLDQLRHYEDLLRQNSIKFEPLHKNSRGDKEGYESEDDHSKTAGVDSSSPATTVSSERPYAAQYMNTYRAFNQDPQDDSDASSNVDVSEKFVKMTWDKMFKDNDYLLFGLRRTATEIATLHPEPAQIFRLWHIYLENVNPLLKVTHTPSLQGRIVEAASNLANIDATLEALMFGIYCTALLSLTPEEVLTMFGVPKEEMLSRCRFGCNEALLNCGFLRSADRDCLTAFYLYLVSVRTSTVPQSLASMLGVALRIAERLGCHSELELARCAPFEAEMRRRLWWSLIIFDARVTELAAENTTKLVPTWDCKVPLNVNDSELRPEMKESPKASEVPSDAIFAVVVIGEIGEYIRNTMFYLDFTTPTLKAIAKKVQDTPIPPGESELLALERKLEDQYLRFCDPENPIHFMTIWLARGFLAKYRVMEYHSNCSTPQSRVTWSTSSALNSEPQRDAAIGNALRMLECDTQILASSLTKRFLWVLQLYFPFAAYILIANNLKRRPLHNMAAKAWEIMNDNYVVRFSAIDIGGDTHSHSALFKIFRQVVLSAWEPREVALKQAGDEVVMPKIVTELKQAGLRDGQNAVNDNKERPSKSADMGVNDESMPLPMAFGNTSMFYGMGEQSVFPGMNFGTNSHMPGFAPLDFDINNLDWGKMDWDLVDAPVGEGGGATGY